MLKRKLREATISRWLSGGRARVEECKAPSLLPARWWGYKLVAIVSLLLASIGLSAQIASSGDGPPLPDHPAVGAVVQTAELPLQYRISQRCASGELDHKTCKIKWRKLLPEEFLHMTSEHLWNIATDEHVRDSLVNPPHGGFWSSYWFTVKRFRFNHWSDDVPFEDDYIGHPMQGAISSYILIQNDPSGMSLELENTRAYWMSRLRAFAWSAVYSTQWKLGPLSEASVGNTGCCFFYDPAAGKITNNTGFVTLVSTPVGGFLWVLGEDALDRHMIRRLEGVSQNPVWLLGISFLNPTRSFANLTRFQSPWHRDSRPVRRPRIAGLTHMMPASSAEAGASNGK